MNSVSDARNLRRRAQDRLNREISTSEASHNADLKRQLYELRLNQIEIELLSDEFHKLRQKLVPHRHNPQTLESSGLNYFFLNRNGRVCEAKFTSSDLAASDGVKWEGRLLSDFIPQELRSQFKEFLRVVFESDGKNSCELSFEPAGKKKSNHNFPVYASIEAIADEEKLFCLAVIEDISTRKVAEEREKASNASLAMLERTIAASRNEIFMFDAHNLCFTYANQRALENLGYTMNELKWLVPADIQTHVFNQEMADLMTELLAHKRSVGKFNAVHLRKNGSLYPVEIYLQLFEHEAGSYFIAIVLDISKQAAIESKLQSIIESADAIIWAADVNLRLEFMSDQVQEILGSCANQFIGASLIDLLDSGFFHESDRMPLLEGFNQVIKIGSKVSDLRCRALQSDGTWRWLSVNMTPSRSVGGEVNQIVGVMHDIQAQQLAENALLQLNHDLDSRVEEEIQKNKAKDLLLQRQARLAGMGEMIGNIAHQWRQPINSLGLILGDLEDAALYGECDLSYIHTAVGKSKKIIQKMSSTIDDFRHFFRADKSLGVFSLKHVTDECLNLVEAALKSHNIHIEVRCDHDVSVLGYANEYSQALMNILSNAKDAIVESKVAEGKIVIEITELDGCGVHTITDNGGGIPEEAMPKIFEPHFTTKTQGVGIGLYMSLVSIEKNMHGRIVAENVANGAKFSICLPQS